MVVFPVSVPVVQRRVVRASLPRAFAQFLGNAGTAAADARLPALDVLESDAAYTLRFDLPGADKEQLKVSVQGRRVSVETVDAEPQAASAPAQPAAEDGAVVAQEQPQQPVANAERVIYSERRAPRFARTVSLPAEVDEANAEARFDNGVLTLVLAKRVNTGAKRISVN